MTDLATALTTYFSAEKQAMLPIIGIGLLATVAAGWLLFSAGALRGMAVPLGLVGVLELGIGIAVYARTDGQVAALVDERARDSEAMVKVESTRMATVMNTFTVIKAVEVALIALGAGLAWSLSRSDFWFAFGVGLVMQATVMLVFDLFAERRAGPYVAALTHAQPSSPGQ
ncbi:MAG: hypothetical protein IV100_31315 [Myxococcales bacterium]|nr:hypothetical protein [Myxococcales bacterium]